MRRILLLLTVALVMTAMMVAMAAPAFAARVLPTLPPQALEGFATACEKSDGQTGRCSL
jgi:hypothetical protein